LNAHRRTKRNFDKSLASCYDTAPDQNESSKQEILEFEASHDSISTSLDKKKLEILNKFEFERDAIALPRPSLGGDNLGEHVILTVYYQIKCAPLR